MRSGAAWGCVLGASFVLGPSCALGDGQQALGEVYDSPSRGPGEADGKSDESGVFGVAALIDDVMIPDGHPLLGPGAPSTEQLAAASSREPQIVYLNFGGQQLSSGGWAQNNAQSNTSFMVPHDVTVPAFDARPWGDDRAAVIHTIVAGLQQDFARHQLVFTTTRPDHTDYTMMVIGGVPSMIGKVGSIGVAPLDPGNFNRSDVALVFSERMAAFGYSERHVAWVIAHELGHSLGLHHVHREGDIMAPAACHCQQSWGSGPSVDGSQQDDSALLSGVLPKRLLLSAPVLGMAAKADQGYWLAARDGWIFGFGSASYQGSAGESAPQQPIVGVATTPSGDGYWQAASDGTVYAFGDAALHGSDIHVGLHQPTVAMRSTPSGDGYWLAASDGAVFAYGDADFHGSMAASPLNQPIVGMASTASGNGYWLVASDGGIFAFGGAGFHGSAADLSLHAPIVGMASTPSGNGYWLAASDGGVLAYGAAGFHGSAGRLTSDDEVVSIVATPSAMGYWLTTADGVVLPFGDAQFFE